MSDTTILQYKKTAVENTKDLILSNELNYTPDKKEKYLVMVNDLIIDIEKKLKKNSK